MRTMQRGRRGTAKGPRMIQEIIRLKALGLSERKIAKALDCSRNTIAKYLDGELKTVKPIFSEYRAPWSDSVDWQKVHEATLKGTPLSEVCEQFCDVPYVSFWREYRRRYPNIPLDLHKIHPPGERCEVDYKGDSPGLGYIDRRTREFIPCRLFGAVLPFSQLFFPRATLTEKQPDLLRSMAEAYSYFGGVPQTTAVDNAKALVNRAHRYDPDIHREFSHFAEHYGTAPLAMRPGKPKDKNFIENALGVFWRWARRQIAARQFYSLGDLNDFLRELADAFNDRVQRKYGQSRLQKFEAGEREKLLALPHCSYSLGDWKVAKVHPDCHIQVAKNFYSVPYQFRGKEVEVRISEGLVEVFANLECIARHLRIQAVVAGQYRTVENHLPDAHRAMREATPQMALAQAEQVGVATLGIVRPLIEEARHPLMYLRRVQGILRLERRYSREALEKACETLGLAGIKAPRLRDVEGIIKCNLDSRSAAILPMRRGPNPYLRGQMSWRHNSEETCDDNK